DDVALAVAVDVADRHAHAAAERLGVGHVVVHQLHGHVDRHRLAGRVQVALDGRHGPGAVERLDVRPAALAGAGDDVGVAVAVDVADGHVDAAAEALV